MYYQHFTAWQIAKHIQCLIAAKHVAHATNHMRALEFDFTTDHSAFFLTTLGSDPKNPTESQCRTEAKIAHHIGLDFTQSIALTFMASEGPAFRGENERLGIYSMERGHFETARVSDTETSLEILASPSFLKGGAPKSHHTLGFFQSLLRVADCFSNWGRCNFSGSQMLTAF